jgi:hypothetical protein
MTDNTKETASGTWFFDTNGSYVYVLTCALKISVLTS